MRLTYTSSKVDVCSSDAPIEKGDDKIVNEADCDPKTSDPKAVVSKSLLKKKEKSDKEEKRTKDSSRKLDSDSETDSDFQSKNPKKRRKTVECYKQKEHKGKGKKVESEGKVIKNEKKGIHIRRTKPENYTRIKPRTAPSTLIDVMGALNDAQKNAVDELGFKVFREKFNVMYVPTLLGQWVVEKYDPATEKFTFGSGKEIKVNADAINRVLGVPMGRNKIRLVERARESDFTTSNWRMQFNLENNRFYVKYLVNKLMQQQEADFNFKLNFLVLFATIMGECISCGTVNQRFLPSIKSEDDLKDLDWCSFLLNCMNTTRNNWNLKANFNGPLALMVLLYVNSTYKNERVHYGETAIIYWNTDKLNKREEYEINSGGFGKNVVFKSELKQRSKKDATRTQEPVVKEKVKTKQKVKSASKKTPSSESSKDDEPIINLLKRKAVKELKQQQEKKKKMTIKKGGKMLVQKDMFVKETIVEEHVKDPYDTYGTQELVNQLSTPSLKVGNEGLYSHYDKDGVYTGSSSYDPKTLETYKTSLLTKIEVAEDLKKEINEMLKKSLGLFPGDAELKNIEKITNELFVPEEKESELLKKGKEVEISGDKGVDNLSYEGTSFSLGLNQADEINEVENTEGMDDINVALNVLNNNKFLKPDDQPKISENLKNIYATTPQKEKEVCQESMKFVTPEKEKVVGQEIIKFVKPSEKLSLRKSPPNEKQMTKILAVKPISVAYPEEGKKNEPTKKNKRECQPSNTMISPYVARTVSLAKAQAAIEKRMSESIFSAWKNPNDYVFCSYNIDLERVMLENMIPGLAVANNTLDVWTLVLNNEESKRDRSKSARLFCNTSMLSENVMTQIADKVKEATVFEENMGNVLLSSPFASLEDVDLVFFPVYLSEKQHFYLIIYNLKNCDIYIIDNIKSGEDVRKRYGDAPNNLTTVFTEYLKKHKHKSALKLLNAIPIQLKMSWRTLKNGIDCGLFVMRHMETFKGPGDFQTEFKKEGAAQQRQLNDLRVKYVTKIILSDLNEKKIPMIKEAEEFEGLPAEEKEKLKMEAFDKISERVKEYVVSY